MKKKLLTLLVLLMTAVSGAWAADPDESLYQAALAAIEDDADYIIMTDVNGTNYYVTSNGKLTSDKKAAGVFHINKASGGELYNIGFRISYGSRPFSNPPSLWIASQTVNLGYDTYYLSPNYDRSAWERQVLYLNDEGKYAIRASNTAYAESGWADCGRVFWTHTTSDPITPCYSYDPTFIWEFVKYVQTDYDLTVDAENNEHGAVKFFVGGNRTLGANEGDVVTMTVTPDEGWVVNSASATTYTEWAARRKAPATIPILGDVTLTYVSTDEQGVATYTFQMPAASVQVSATYIPVAAFAPAEPSGTLVPTAAEGVIAGEDKAIIVAGTVANIPETTNPQGTVKYFVTDNKDMTAEQAAAANGWVEALPTAAGYTGSYADDFQVYVWYYIQAATGYADSEPQRIEVTVLSNEFDITFNAANANTIEGGKATVKVGDAAATVTEGKLKAVKMGSTVTITTKEGYKFRKVEAKKGAAAEAKTITIGGVELTYADGDTWETIVGKNSDKIKIVSNMIVQLAQPAPDTYKYLDADGPVRPMSLTQPRTTVGVKWGWSDNPSHAYI